MSPRPSGGGYLCPERPRTITQELYRRNRGMFWLQDMAVAEQNCRLSDVMAYRL